MSALSDASSQSAKSDSAASIVRLVVCVFIPFAFGYFLLQLFRAINAPIAGRLASDLAFDAPQLGLLTAAFFLAAASAQLPIGMAIDRFGPGRVQAVCLLIAAAGSALFSQAQSLHTLILARALIGFGISSGLMGGLKAIALWFPKERGGLLNGLFIGCGTIGAVAATIPVEWLLGYTTWRVIFLGLAALTVGLSCLIRLIVPCPVSAAVAGGTTTGLRHIYSDARFWRLAPLSALLVASAWSIMGLWASPWLRDVNGLTSADISYHLFLMALAQGAGAFGLGVVIDQLRRRGIAPKIVLISVVTLFVMAETSLITPWNVPELLPWTIVGLVGAGTVISFTIMAEIFAKDVLGRANSALNVLHMAGSFLIQSSFGVVVGWWPQDAAGHYPATAYQTALFILICGQTLALCWYIRPLKTEAPKMPHLTKLSLHPRLRSARLRSAALLLVAGFGAGLAVGPSLSAKWLSADARGGFEPSLRAMGRLASQDELHAQQKLAAEVQHRLEDLEAQLKKLELALRESGVSAGTKTGPVR